MSIHKNNVDACEGEACSTNLDDCTTLSDNESQKTSVAQHSDAWWAARFKSIQELMGKDAPRNRLPRVSRVGLNTIMISFGPHEQFDVLFSREPHSNHPNTWAIPT